MKKILLLLLFVCCSCQKATTNSPVVNAAEIQEEKHIQQSMNEEMKLQSSQRKRKKRLDMQQRLHEVAVKIEPHARELCHKIIGANEEKTCIYPIELSKKGGLNAYADGKKVVILSGMMQFAKEDEELAYIISHELAHNIMNHPDSTKNNAIVGGLFGVVVDVLAASQGVNTQGLFTKTGANADVLSYSQDFEKEADYIGMYILAISGYDAAKAPDLWRRMSVRNPDGIYVGKSHPANPERFVAMNKTINEIKLKQINKKPLVPDFNIVKNDASVLSKDYPSLRK